MNNSSAPPPAAIATAVAHAHASLDRLWPGEAADPALRAWIADLRAYLTAPDAAPQAVVLDPPNAGAYATQTAAFFIEMRAAALDQAGPVRDALAQIGAGPAADALLELARATH